MTFTISLSKARALFFAVAIASTAFVGWLSPLSAMAGQTLEPLFETPRLQANSEQPPSGSASGGPKFVLQGSVSTIQEAIAEETSIDWYRWYLGAREYLFRTGGLPCDLGTDIKFHKNGRIEPISNDPRCVSSLGWRNFPLPKDTQLSAVILPVRSGQAPPASPAEIYSRVGKDSKDK